jgi:acetyl esterase/lipase
VIPAQRLFAATSAGAAVLAGVVLLANPGAAVARARTHSTSQAPQVDKSEPTSPALTGQSVTAPSTAPATEATPAATDAGPAADPAQSSSTSSTQATSMPTNFSFANAPVSTSGLPDFPSVDGDYPQVLPAVRVSETRLIVSNGVPLNFQNVGYGDPTEHNSYDVYWPASPSLRRGGAVLMIHGGSWVMGNKSLDTPYAMAVARAGYVVAAMDYSTWPNLRAWPAAVQDAFAVADSFRSRANVYGFDPAHLVAAGWSAGGNLAELLGTVGRGTDRVAAVVSWSGISDLPALNSSESTVPLANTLATFFGCPLMACPKLWLNASPVTYVGPGDAPSLLFAGDREFIPTTQSSELADKLGAAGVPATLDILDTDLHGGDERPLTVLQLMDWLHRYADVEPQVDTSTPPPAPGPDLTSISLRTAGK